MRALNNNDKNEKKFINIECNDFERLNAFLSSLPEYQSFSLEAKELILEFINKVREANKTKSIQGGRGSELVGLFKGILDKTDEESLLVGLRKAFRKMEKEGFDFKKRNPTGYVWSVAKSHKIQKNQAKLLAPSLEEREMLQVVQGGEVYRNLKSLINIQGGDAA